MSSWLSLSLSTLFFKGFHDDEDEGDHPQQNPSPPSVKDGDISSVIGRRLRGVAAFLAPPPTSSGAGTSATEDTSSDTLLGIKNDLVEIGGSFKTKLSLLSSNKAVTDISRFASNFLQFGDAEDEKMEGEGLGLTDELVEFVRDISKRPELWLDFPMELGNDFNRSDIQREHTAAVEHMVPSIAALRHEISEYLDEEQFWKIYFTLLLPRLNENDSKLLSTPEIVETRDILLQKLQNKNMTPMGDSEVFESVQTSRNMVSDSSSEVIERPSCENEDLANMFNAGLMINNCKKTKKFSEHSGSTYTSIDEIEQSVEDMSLSNLKIDDDYLSEGKKVGFMQAEIKHVPASCESNDWVEVTDLEILGDKQKAAQSTSKDEGSESDDSNEWLTVNDSDLDCPASGFWRNVKTSNLFIFDFLLRGGEVS